MSRKKRRRAAPAQVPVAPGAVVGVLPPQAPEAVGADPPLVHEAVEVAALPVPMMMSDLQTDLLDELPAPEVEPLAPMPLPVITTQAPAPPRPARAVPRPARFKEAEPVIGGPRGLEDVVPPELGPGPEAPLTESKEVLADATRQLTPWKEVVLTPEPIIASRRELSIGILFALVTAGTGFFLTRGHLAAGLARWGSPLDRRQAEAPAARGAGDNRMRFAAPSAGGAITYIPYAGADRAGGSGDDSAGVTVVTTAGVSPTPEPVASATPAPSVPAQTPVPAPPPPPPVAAVPARTPEPVVAPHPPSTLWPPTPADRHPETSLEQAWRQVAGSVMKVQPSGGEVVSGVVVDSSGLLLTRWSALNGQDHVLVQTSAGPESGEVLGGVDGIDLALIRLPGGTYVAATLSPEAPAMDRPLGYVPAQGSAALEQARPAGEVGSTTGLFRFLGVVGVGDSGNVLVNARGEVAGLVLGKPQSFPGSTDCLATDTSLMWQVMQAHARGSLVNRLSDTNLMNTQFKAMLAAELPPEGSPGGAGTDVVAGVGMGIYRLGMSLPRLQKMLGTIAEPSVMSDLGWTSLHQAGDGLEFVLADGRVVAVRTTNPQFTTRRGLGVGALTVNIDLQREANPWATGQWTDGQSFMMSPGLEMWAGHDGKVTWLLVEPAQGSPTNNNGGLTSTAPGAY